MASPLTVSTGAPHARLLSVGGCRGSRVVDNAEICTMIDSSDEWITQRTGITERRWAADGETVLTLGTAAARTAIERAGLEPAQIDAVICSTMSHFKQTPALACEIAAALGCPAPAAFDLSAACAGFGYGVTTAEALVRSGAATHVLVVGVEVLSDLLDRSDRSTVFIFSDGAGAVVIGPSEVPAIGRTVWGSDPAQSQVITVDDWALAAREGITPSLHMQGQAVFRWATTFIADRARETIEAAGITADELDVFIPHQANNRITDSMLRHLKLPERVVVSRDIVRMGNSSAASIPLAMEAMLASGEASSGQTALCIGFGAGLAFAGQVLTLP